jgi:hypothetical protein
MYVDSVAVGEVGDGMAVGEAMQLGLAVGGHAHDELEARLAPADPGDVPARVIAGGGRGGGVVVTVTGSHVDPLPDVAHPVALDLAEPDLRGGAADEVRGALAAGSGVPIAVAAGLGGLAAAARGHVAHSLRRGLGMDRAPPSWAGLWVGEINGIYGED